MNTTRASGCWGETKLGGVGRSVAHGSQELGTSLSLSPDAGRGMGGNKGEKQYEKANMGTEPKKLDLGVLAS